MSGGVGQGWQIPNSWKKGEEEEELKIVSLLTWFTITFYKCYIYFDYIFKYFLFCLYDNIKV
jgi:hypothetical protein